MSFYKYAIVLIIFLVAVALSTACLPITSAIPAATELSEPVSEELNQYMLKIINKDRTDKGLSPLVLGTNTAAQTHAEDMLANYYLSHWGTDGLKPYMRYTRAGGINFEAENSAYHGWYDTSENPEMYVTIDPREVLNQLQYNMMFDDADSNWGHRDTILGNMNEKVNIGIAYDEHRLALVQQFEGDYVLFTQPPAIVNNELYVTGSLIAGNLYSLRIFYDVLPQPLTQQQLLEKPRYYYIGEEIGYVLPPKYKMENMEYVNASKWETENTGSFKIVADISPLLKYPKGVYTICIVATIKDELTSLSNYSIFIR